jgi:hypothetical protein
MKKKRKQQKPKNYQVRYLVRVNTHKDLKGKRIALKEQKRSRKIITKVVTLDVKPYEVKIGKRYYIKRTKDVKVKGYYSTRNQGNDRAEWVVYYTRDKKIVDALINQDIKAFKSSKKKLITASVQMFQGKVHRYYDGRLIDGTITPAVQLRSLYNTLPLNEALSAGVRLHDEYENLSMDDATDKNFNKKKGTSSKVNVHTGKRKTSYEIAKGK